MGPVEQVIREIIEQETDKMERSSGVPRNSPRFPLAGISALMRTYREFSATDGEVDDEEALDFLNAIYAILGAYTTDKIEGA